HPVVRLCVSLLNAPPATQAYTLSLHDALPISTSVTTQGVPQAMASATTLGKPSAQLDSTCRSSAFITAGTSSLEPASRIRPRRRSEEHTSELQSRENLVCRLLLEKKKGRRSRS